MRIESIRYTERFGSVRINDVQKVLELDAGRANELPLKEDIAVHRIEEDTIKDFEERRGVLFPRLPEKLNKLQIAKAS